MRWSTLELNQLIENKLRNLWQECGYTQPCPSAKVECKDNCRISVAARDNNNICFTWTFRTTDLLAEKIAEELVNMYKDDSAGANEYDAVERSI